MVNGKYRRLSAEEIAVIQGFPVSYLDGFTLTTNDKISLLGNAVPPPLAKAIGSVLLSKLKLKNNTFVEICAGIGGLSAGFDALKPLACIEIWDKACVVLKKRLGSNSGILFQGKAQEFDFNGLRGKVGFLIGGPPCQPWSQGGAKKGAMDPRDVMGATPDFLSTLQPEVFLFENVPGLISSKEHQLYVEDLLDRLSSPGAGINYGVQHFILNAADYGVPQVRRRVFILGVKGFSRTKVFSLVDAVKRAATHSDPSKPSLNKKPWITLGEALAEVEHREQWMSLPAPEDSYAPPKDEGIRSQPEGPSSATAETISEPAKRLISPPKDRLELFWPHKHRRLFWSDARWRFLDPSEDSEKRALLFQELLGTKPTAKGICGMVAVGPEWDSLDCLATSLPKPAAFIYIDTPRLDSDQDSFAQEVPQDLRESAWLSWLRQIIIAARRTMDSRGIIVVHTNQKTAHHARHVLDEAFGSNSHVTTFAWEKKYAPQNDSPVPTDAFDYLITYSLCDRESISPARLSVEWSDLVDDEDYRGKFFAGHKGAKSGTEASKFAVNAPPYRWRIVSGPELPKASRFDPVCGILWIEKVASAGKYEFVVEATDKLGATATGKVVFEAVDGRSAQTPLQVPWLFAEPPLSKQSARLRVLSSGAGKAIVGAPFSLVMQAQGGMPFTIKQRKPGKGRFWEFSKANLESSLLEGRVYFGSKGVSLPSIKKYTGGAASKLVATRNWLPWEEVGKTEDATRQLKTLAAENIIAADFPPIAKPEKLLDRLLSLFAPERSDVVVSIGDPNASLAARCVESGRWFCHLVGPRPVDDKNWRGVAKPRLAHLLASSTADSPSSIACFSVSESRITTSPPEGVVGVLHANEEPVAALYAGCVGCVLPLRDEPAFASFRGERAVVMPPDEILDAKHVSDISAKCQRSGKILYIIAERWMESELSSDSPLVTLLRAPYDLAPRLKKTL
jgi:DNA-cytosine methyltransferase